MTNKLVKDEEAELIRLYKESGDQKYIAELYEPYIQLIYGLCLKYFKNPHDAEDATMDIYIGILKKLMRHDVNNFKSWIYVVSKNHCLDKLRSRGSKISKEKEAHVMYSEEVFHPDNDDNDSRVAKLEACVENLPPEQKTCIEMFYFRKISYQEITELTQFTWGQVRSYIQNGRRNLKNCMEKL